MPKKSDFSLKIRRKCMPRRLFRQLKDLVQLIKGLNFEIFSQESEHLRCGGNKKRKSHGFCPDSHATGEIIDTDPLPSVFRAYLSKKQLCSGFCFIGGSMEKADNSCIFPRLWGEFERTVAECLRVIPNRAERSEGSPRLTPLDNKYLTGLSEKIRGFFVLRIKCGVLRMTHKKWINSSAESIANILLLAIFVLEMAMPHKILAANFMRLDDGTGAKYQFAELALASDVYAFNDKYVPEEIELQKLAAERAKGGFEVISTTTVTTTAYSSTVDQCDSTPFIAASGRRVHDGMVAANFLPFDAKIRIPEIFGDKIFVVEDRMNRRFQNRVDIWMESREKALRYGVRNVNIEILEEF